GDSVFGASAAVLEELYPAAQGYEHARAETSPLVESRRAARTTVQRAQATRGRNWGVQVRVWIAQGRRQIVWLEVAGRFPSEAAVKRTVMSIGVVLALLAGAASAVIGAIQSGRLRSSLLAGAAIAAAVAMAAALVATVAAIPFRLWTSVRMRAEVARTMAAIDAR